MNDPGETRRPGMRIPIRQRRASSRRSRNPLRVVLTAQGALVVLVVLVSAGVAIFQRQGSERTDADLPPPEVPRLSEPGQVSLDRNFFLIIDGSGSMEAADCAGQFPSRTEAAKWAVKEFTTQRVPADVNLALHAFDGFGNRERVPLGKENRGKIVSEIDAIRGGGSTPLNAAIRAGATSLTTQRERQLGYGEFYVVVATDGEATDGDLESGAVRYAQQQRIPIITIGFCLKSNHPLARHSISYREANSPQELLAALQETQGESAYFDVAVFRRN